MEKLSFLKLPPRIMYNVRQYTLETIEDIIARWKRYEKAYLERTPDIGDYVSSGWKEVMYKWFKGNVSSKEVFKRFKFLASDLDGWEVSAVDKFNLRYDLYISFSPDKEDNLAEYSDYGSYGSIVFYPYTIIVEECSGEVPGDFRFLIDEVMITLEHEMVHYLQGNLKSSKVFAGLPGKRSNEDKDVEYYLKDNEFYSFLPEIINLINSEAKSRGEAIEILRQLSGFGKFTLGDKFNTAYNILFDYRHYDMSKFKKALGKIYKGLN
jgi:hypothetical protein